MNLFDRCDVVRPFCWKPHFKDPRSNAGQVRQPYPRLRHFFRLHTHFLTVAARGAFIETQPPSNHARPLCRIGSSYEDDDARTCHGASLGAWVRAGGSVGRYPILGAWCTPVLQCERYSAFGIPSAACAADGLPLVHQLRGAMWDMGECT